MKTDGSGNPHCPHGCGFDDKPDVEHQDPKPTFREFLRQQTTGGVDYRGRGA